MIRWSSVLGSAGWMGMCFLPAVGNVVLCLLTTIEPWQTRMTVVMMVAVAHCRVLIRLWILMIVHISSWYPDDDKMERERLTRDSISGFYWILLMCGGCRCFVRVMLQYIKFIGFVICCLKLNKFWTFLCVDHTIVLWDCLEFEVEHHWDTF